MNARLRDTKRSLTALAANIDGKWISERQVGAADGKTYNHTTVLTLKNDGGVLTGTVVQTSAAPWMSEANGRSVDISDGKVDGDKFSFKLTMDTNEVQGHWHNPALRCKTTELERGTCLSTIVPTGECLPHRCL